MLSLSFTPLLPWPVLAGLGCVVLVLAVLAFLARGRTATLRALVLTLVLAALANPALVREDREPVKDVAAIVVDRSGSQQLGDRPQVTDQLRAELQRRLGPLTNIEPRFIDVPDSRDGDGGTKLFTALGQALADVPPERLAGVVMLTDGVVHDVPGALAQLGIKAPLHVLVTGHPDERDRQIKLLEAPRFGIVGKELTIRAEVMERGGTGHAVVTVRRDGEEIGRRDVPTDRPFPLTLRIEHGGPNVVEIEVEPLPGELTTVNNRGAADRGHPREAPGAARLRRAAPGRAHVAQPAEIRRQRRPRPLHHPAPAGEAGRHADLRIVADRLPDARAVRPEDQGLRPDHLRPLRQPERPAVGLLRQHRALRARGRRPADRGGSRIRRRGEPRAHPAVGHPAGRPRRARGRAALQGDSDRDRPAPPRHPRLPGSESNPPAWGDWLRIVQARTRAGVQPILSGAEGLPLLALSREDKGRVALLLSDHAWLWARGYQEGGPYLDLLRRLAHWLMKEPALEEEALRAQTTGHGREVRVERQTMADTAEPVTVTGPTGTATTLTLKPAEPGLFTGTFEAQTLGLHTLRSGNLVAFLSVGPANPRELADVFSDTERLRPAAEGSGGSVRRVADAAGGVQVPRLQSVRTGRLAGADWIGFRPSDSANIRGVEVYPLALGLAALAALAAAVLAMWLVEGRRGRAT